MKQIRVLKPAKIRLTMASYCYCNCSCKLVEDELL